MNADAESFLAGGLPLLVAAERAYRSGDVEPRLGLWSHRDPVTLFGLRYSQSGWPALSATFRNVAPVFSDLVDYRFELVAAGASGDLAYIVGYEHDEVTIEGGHSERTLRSTYVYRREDAHWRIAHRHADVMPASSAAQQTPRRPRSQPAGS